MLKISGKLWFLVLCLSLVISIALISPSEAVTGISSTDSSLLGEDKKETYTIEEPTVSEPTASEPTTPEPTTLEPTTPEPTTLEPTTPESTALEPTTSIDLKGDNSSDLSDKTEVNNLSKTDNKSPESTTPPLDNGFFHVILIIVDIVLGLLVILCLIVFLRMNDRLKNVEKRLKKNNSSESEASTKLSPTERGLSEKVAKLGKELLETKRDFQRQLQEMEYKMQDLISLVSKLTEEQTSESLQRNSLRRISPTNNLSQTQPLNKGIYGFDDKFKPTPKIDKIPQESSEIREIVVAFNEMMRETAKAQGFGSSMQIRQKFIKDYRVIAFKCVNFEERVNRPEVQPRFETSDMLENTLWGTPLQDGTLAVLPGLRQYESTAHSQGGLKELFRSSYISGSYRKIEVIKPAIVTRDYKIIEKGELSLSR